jgi:hypothetical protein
MGTRKFWVVMGTNGLSHSPYLHTSEDAATTEAKRLAQQHRGTFVVLEAKGAAAPIQVQFSTWEESEEIPF